MNDELPMPDRRYITRYNLSTCLTVYNRNTGRVIGSIGNISARGLMLIAQWPMMVGEVFNLRIQLPSSENGPVNIDFDARCHWSKQDVDPQYYDTGFSVEWADPEMQDLAATLKEYFSFKLLER